MTTARRLRAGLLRVVLVTLLLAGIGAVAEAPGHRRVAAAQTPTADPSVQSRRDRGPLPYIGIGVVVVAVFAVGLTTSRRRSRALDEMVHAQFGRGRGGGGGGTYGDFR